MLETFSEITIGGLTKEALLKRLHEANIQFNKYAELLFNHAHFSPSAQAEKVTLVKVKLSQLSLNSPCAFRVILDQASALGLKPCPLYLAAFLRLEYLHQPEGPYLTIASTPPESDESFPTGFYLRNVSNSLWLRGYRVVDEADWPLDNEFVFCASQV